VTGDLSVFSDPRSVAVVGASADPTKWGYWLARGALQGAHRRSVHLVNARGAVIEGAPSSPSLRDLPEVPELVVLCTPAASAPAVIDEALDLGTRGLLAITAGMDLVHGQAGLERRLAATVRAAGARLIGPNCLGIYDATSELELAWGTFTPGNLAIVSQSGQLGLELAGLAAHAGLGVSRFVSIGNQADVTAVEVLVDLVDHESTKAVVLYLEAFDDGRALLSAMARLRAAGKPVVVLTVGASEASRTAARSHTGALTAATEVVAAGCRAAGSVLVDTPAQAVELAHLLLGSPLPTGRKVAVVSDSGGQGALAADTLAREGLVVPRLSATTAQALARSLPATAAVGNPVDLAGAGEQDLDSYSHVVETLLDSGEVDAVVLTGYFGCYGDDAPELVERELEVVKTLADAARVHGRTVVVHSMSHDSRAVQMLRANAVPTLHTIDAAARSLALAADLSERGGDPVPDATPGPVATDGRTMSYLEARARVAAYGVAYPGAQPVRTPDDVRAAAGRLTAPYVLKAGWIEHRSDVGGVAAGLRDADAAVAALLEMSARLGDGEYVLEEMDTRSSVVELIVGVRRDPAFGPVVLVGLGGVQAEVYRDVQLALAPVTADQARAMLERLRGHALLAGWRGAPAVDVDAAADVTAALSRLVVEQTDVAEIEINPLRVGPVGTVAVDALVVVDDSRALAEFSGKVALVTPVGPVTTLTDSTRSGRE
jgi:acyl-CoA synthetase (NDP forming)